MTGNKNNKLTATKVPVTLPSGRTIQAVRHKTLVPRPIASTPPAGPSAVAKPSFQPVTAAFISLWTANLPTSDGHYGARRCAAIAEETNRVLTAQRYNEADDAGHQAKTKAALGAFNKLGPSFYDVEEGLLRDFMTEFDQKVGDPTDAQLAELTGLINGMLASGDYQESTDPDSMELASMLSGCFAVMRGETVDAVPFR
ncbi:hypothetical protein [Frigoribacterium sp. UYMn621]|uniref:hypothetical protein n=1 Tax=Frigoribacterium sp. UYMn621 TaxID=3156343 RepID=UPI00339A3F50